MTIACNIKFDNNLQGIYYAGQNLSGTVEISLGVPKKVKGMLLFGQMRHAFFLDKIPYFTEITSK